MTLSAQLVRLFQPETAATPRHRLEVALATTTEQVRTAQYLRHQVLVEDDWHAHRPVLAHGPARSTDVRAGNIRSSQSGR